MTSWTAAQWVGFASFFIPACGVWLCAWRAWKTDRWRWIFPGLVLAVYEVLWFVQMLLNWHWYMEVA